MRNKNNSISVIGAVISDCVLSHIAYNRSFYIFHIDVKRRSLVSDILPVIAPEHLIKSVKVSAGDEIQVTGEIRSCNRYSETENKSKLLMYIHARSVSISKEYCYNSNNAVFLDGHVCKTPVYRVTPLNREIADIVLSVERVQGWHDIPCIVWGFSTRIVCQISIGDRLRLWGRMQSRVYEKHGISGDVEKKTAYEISAYKIKPYASGQSETVIKDRD